MIIALYSIHIRFIFAHSQMEFIVEFQQEQSKKNVKKIESHNKKEMTAFK